MTPPSVFISYTHDSPEHKDAILALSERLRQEGVDCVIDQYEQAPAEGWPSWCARQVKDANFVLVACTETYLRRIDGEEEPGKGLGGTWEGHVITQQLYNAQGRNTKFIPVIFRGEDSAFVPLTLQSAQAYILDGDYELLYRRLTSQPLTIKSTVGTIKMMAQRLPPQPKLERKEEFEPLSNLPSRKIALFTGREQVLASLRETLQRRGRAALSGLGGMGKTQTALEYARLYRQEYKALFWVDADSREQLLASFVSIAAVLNLPSAQAREQQAAVVEVHRWLEENSDWLLIFDNADDLPLISDFLPGAAKGHLLLTTREHAVAALAERVRVEEMPPDEGAALLLRRISGIAKDTPLAEASAADLRAARELSKELGGLPLALDQAGAFIEEKQLRLSEYAELYASEKSALLRERGSLGDHPSVTVTFALAFQRVAEKNPAAGDLIRLCGFLAPDAIPEEIFSMGDSSALGETLATAAASRLSFTNLIGDACRFSLLDRDQENKTLDIHRLVQTVTKAEMSKAEQRAWAERAVRALAAAFPYVDYESWPRCQRLISHAQACVSLIEEWEFDFVEAARLLNEAGFYLRARGLYAEAEPLNLRLLAIREKALGEDHPDVAQSLNNLAALYDDQGRYAQAEPLFVRSLAIREKALGPDHPRVALILNNLALLYDNQGKYAEAEPLFVRSLAIREKALGPDHPNVATSLNNLAGLYDNQGKYAEAEPLYIRSLAICEKALVPDHPDVAQGLNNLAGLYCKQNRYAEAEPFFLRSSAIFEKALGPDHPDVASSLNNLAALYDNQGKYAEAEPLYLRSLTILEKALGPNHPNVATSLNNLAGLYDKQGRYVEAEPLYLRSLAIREKALGPDHPDVATSLENLAGLYESQGRDGEAEPLRRRAQAIRNKAQGN